ncbi:hypothetical protein WME89_28730 [Sorangium sp. So ce321]|uniref:hypothetical protein n=1 Tax=Sorangium sp. So ce321 TaxID=3133300 RepID=UPI003F62452C
MEKPWKARSGRGALRCLAGLALGVASAAGLTGCYAYHCEGDLMCAPPPAPPSASCDEADAVVLPQDACGVFVAHRGDDADEGTRKEPVRTLRRAVEKARNEGKRRVFACAEAFDEAVTLPSGIDLWGGRDCTTDEWGWPGSYSVTEIAPEPGRVPLKVEATQGIGTSNISAVRLVAADAIEAGAPSIAMRVTDGGDAVVTWSELIAGNGADGEPGEDAPLERAQNGAPANHGAAICSDELVQGGAIAVTECADGITSAGGSGGVGERDAGGAGETGVPAPPPLEASSEGRGGRGERATGACEPGVPGRDGAGGTSGNGALQSSVHLSSSGLHAAPGLDGTPGGTAQGGGGGGGTRGRGVCGRGEPQGGASGGSGGGGGCGGRAGKGGGTGGSSIATVVVGAKVEFDHTTLHAGRGGNGGAGGRGQQGGRGYPGGYGGEAGMTAGGEIRYACDGGHGGKGGDGGHGGGGLGGSSVGIARDDSDVTILADVEFTLRGAGAGGPGGDPGDARAAGQAGLTEQFWSINGINSTPPR